MNLIAIHRTIILVLFFYLIPAQDLQAEFFYCQDRLVSYRDSMRQVEKKCGPPADIYQQQESKEIYIYKQIFLDYDQKQPERKPDWLTRQQILHQNHSDVVDDEDEQQAFYRLVKVKRITIDYEEWLYHLGPNQFVRTLSFVNQRLQSIESHGYGVDPKAKEANRLPQLGSPKALVVLQLGVADEEDFWQEENTTLHHWQEGDWLTVEHTHHSIEWSKLFYESKLERLSRTLLFKNNRLVDD